MKKKVALLGLWDVSNYGDPVLAFCTKNLLTNSFGGLGAIDIVEVSLKPVLKISLCRRVIEASFCRFARIFGVEQKIRMIIMVHRVTEYYSKILRNFDAIVFAGGGIIKYRIEIFDYIIESILKIAKAKGIPVALNAVGIEGYDSTDERCMELKKHLNSPILKYISTRDDLQTLTKDYLDGNTRTLCERVADPAVWSAECFGTHRDESSNVVGIGVARGDIFKDYGRNFTAGEMINLYEKMVYSFLNKGFRVELFTNGLNLDNEFLEKVMARLSNTGVKKRIPVSAKELVETIASYRAIVTTRMHAGIIAYSLDIPAIGLVWNDKIKFFWTCAGHPENCVDVESLTSNNVTEALENAIKKGYNQEYKQKYRKTIKDGIANIASILV